MDTDSLLVGDRFWSQQEIEELARKYAGRTTIMVTSDEAIETTVSRMGLDQILWELRNENVRYDYPEIRYNMEREPLSMKYFIAADIVFRGKEIKERRLEAKEGPVEEMMVKFDRIWLPEKKYRVVFEVDKEELWEHA